jgi:hypothetical protein
MTKQEILKEIESILDNFETQESECLITFSLEKLSSKSKIKKKYSLNRKNQLESIVDQLSMLKSKEALEKYAEKTRYPEKQQPYIQPWPYIIPNNPIQTPWYWDKVICENNNGSDSITDHIKNVKGYNYP